MILGFSIYSKKNVNISSKVLIIASWARIPSIIEISAMRNNSRFVLICDEAHAMQSLKSIRTQAALELCKSSHCVGVILATGTPMKNGRPINLFPLLVGIRHTLSLNKILFEKLYCNAKKTKFCSWDVSGASNLPELRQKIGRKLLRKTKVYNRRSFH